jgi:hypothetical protein
VPLWADIAPLGNFCNPAAKSDEIIAFFPRCSFGCWSAPAVFGGHLVLLRDLAVPRSAPDRSLGVADLKKQITETLRAECQVSLPTIAEIKAELSEKQSNEPVD